MARKTIIKIDESEFPQNSNTSKKPRVAPIRDRDEEIFEPDEIREDVVSSEPKKAQRVTRGNVVRKKKTFVQSVAEAIAGEGSRDVISYIIQEVLVPAAKNTIQDAITSGIEMFLYGESKGPSSRPRRDRDRSVISYGSYYKPREREERRERRHFATYNDRFKLNEIYFTKHGDAEDVLEELCDRLKQYEQVTVADFFDLAGIEGTNWVHQKYGWDDLSRAYNTHTRYGWAIVFPEPEELE